MATVEEAKKVAWKPTRTKGNEYIYEGVKKAWLEKTIHGNTEVWGKAPITSAAAATSKKAAKEEEATIEDKEPEAESEEVSETETEEESAAAEEEQPEADEEATPETKEDEK